MRVHTSGGACQWWWRIYIYFVLLAQVLGIATTYSAHESACNVEFLGQTTAFTPEGATSWEANCRQVMKAAVQVADAHPMPMPT